MSNVLVAQTPVAGTAHDPAPRAPTDWTTTSMQRRIRRRLEHAVRAGTAGVNDPLGDALMIEVEDLLAEDEILQQRRTARAGL